MACRARVLADPVNIPGLPLYHKTTCCSNKADKKITTDDGDAHVPICLACFRRFITKGLKDPSRNLWLGWFDDVVPSEARVKGSAWYYQQLRSYWEAQQPATVVDKCRGQAFPPSWYRQLEEGLEKAVTDAEEEQDEDQEQSTEEQSLEAELEELGITGAAGSTNVEEVLAEMEKLSIKDTKEEQKAAIQAQIDAINAWMKGEGRTLYKQQPAKHRELIKLRTQLRLL